MTRMWRPAALAAAVLFACGQTATAQNANLEKLQQFKPTGTPLEIEKVPQKGDAADSIKKGLAKSAKRAKAAPD